MDARAARAAKHGRDRATPAIARFRRVVNDHIEAARDEINKLKLCDWPHPHQRLREEIPEDDYVVEIGKARTAREGRDLSIITFGAQVLNALDAAEELAREGIEIEVIDLRTIAPMDKGAIIATVKKTSKAMVLHEASRTGGIGGEIAAVIAEEAFEWLDAPVVRVAAIDTPVPYSPPLEEYHLPQVKDVVNAARKLAEY
jgi:2-oxoisovalerate dehydrogenase E1 component beta subunit